VKRRPIHIGIFGDYGSSLCPDEGIGVFVHQLIPALLAADPDVRVTLRVHPGDQYRMQKMLGNFCGRLRLDPPPVWRPLGRWLDLLGQMRCKVQGGVLEPLSAFLQNEAIRVCKSLRQPETPPGKRWLLLGAGVVALVLATPAAWLAALAYHLLVHGVVRALAFPGQVIVPPRGTAEAYPLPRCDVWLFPHGRSAVATDAPEVVVLWDVAHHHVSGVFGAEMEELTDKLFAQRARRARRIICASEATRDLDLHRLYPDLADRFRVVPLAMPADLSLPTPQQCQRIRRRYGLHRPFLFYPAALRAHKNHASLIQALVILHEEHGLDLDLVLTGKGDLSQRLRRRIAWGRLANRVRHLGVVPRRHLPALYRLAQLTVIPTLHEGYGLPVLEALRCGGVVCCSNIPALVELLHHQRTAFKWFDPRDPQDMARAIAATLARRQHYAAMQSLARERLGRRTWNDVALDYLSILRQATDSAGVPGEDGADLSSSQEALAHA
jgi:glycosyltransferase involved in cell wall biosynthesis